MATPVQDQVIAPLAELMLVCYQAEISRVAKPPGSVCLRTGDQVDLLIATGRDECCEGLAWVRLVDAFPSSSFPQPDQTPQPKGPAAWAVVLELGAARCAPVAASSSEIPSCQQWTDATLAVLDDLAAARRAVCCFAETRSWRKILVGNNRPLRTEGGCIGGTLQVTVQAMACDCVDEEASS